MRKKMYKEYKLIIIDSSKTEWNYKNKYEIYKNINKIYKDKYNEVND